MSLQGSRAPNPGSAPTNIGRRHFVQWLLGTGVVATVVSFVYPVLRFLIPPKVANLGSNTVVAANVGELALNSDKIFRFGDKPGILILTPGDKYVALSAVCTHLGCTVRYRKDRDLIWCPCHNGWYDLTGRNIAGPPPRPLTRYEVHVKGKEIVVSRGEAA
jgi:cytochrome b6-f complex iron-sulfur subunit